MNCFTTRETLIVYFNPYGSPFFNPNCLLGYLYNLSVPINMLKNMPSQDMHLSLNLKASLQNDVIIWMMVKSRYYSGLCSKLCFCTNNIKRIYKAQIFRRTEHIFSKKRVKTVKVRKRFKERSLKIGVMKRATAAEVQVALQSLLAYLQPPDDYLVHYTTSVWRELKARINFRQNVKKRKKFKEMIRDAFEMYCARKQNNQHVTKAI